MAAFKSERVVNVLKKNMDVYETLNNVPTQLIAWGDPFANNSDSDVIVIIPGCPGIPEFYREFGAELYENTKLSVCIVGKRITLRNSVFNSCNSCIKKRCYLFFGNLEISGTY